MEMIQRLFACRRKYLACSGWRPVSLFQVERWQMRWQSVLIPNLGMSLLRRSRAIFMFMRVGAMPHFPVVQSHWQEGIEVFCRLKKWRKKYVKQKEAVAIIPMLLSSAWKIPPIGEVVPVIRWRFWMKSLESLKKKSAKCTWMGLVYLMRWPHPDLVPKD